MSAKEELFDSIADVYTLPVLRWARGKLGDREKAGDLAQEKAVRPVPRRAGRPSSPLKRLFPADLPFGRESPRKIPRMIVVIRGISLLTSDILSAEGRLRQA